MSKYKSFKGIVFKEPIEHNLYIRLNRSKDPVKEIKIIEESMGRELVDRKKVKKQFNDLKRLLLIISGVFAYFGYIQLIFL